jgi:hypothetical protein
VAGARGRALELARERGMTIEHGGHLLPELLPAGDLRALAAGEPPSEAVKEILAEHVRAHPEADVLHLWGADMPVGPARDHEAPEAALRTANAVGRWQSGSVRRSGGLLLFRCRPVTSLVPDKTPKLRGQVIGE